VQTCADQTGADNDDNAVTTQNAEAYTAPTRKEPLTTTNRSCAAACDGLAIARSATQAMWDADGNSAGLSDSGADEVSKMRADGSENDEARGVQQHTDETETSCEASQVALEVAETQMAKLRAWEETCACACVDQLVFRMKCVRVSVCVPARRLSLPLSRSTLVLVRADSTHHKLSAHAHKCVRGWCDELRTTLDNMRQRSTAPMSCVVLGDTVRHSSALPLTVRCSTVGLAV
jgi:hypothetical protein